MSTAIAGLEAAQAVYELAQTDQPLPVEPDGIGPLITKFAGWVLWIGGAAVMVGFLLTGVKLSLGRTRSSMSADALGSIPYIIGGGVMLVSAGAFAKAVVGF